MTPFEKLLAAALVLATVTMILQVFVVAFLIGKLS